MQDKLLTLLIAAYVGLVVTFTVALAAAAYHFLTCGGCM